ncbi:MAG: hypothetical protein OXG37_01300 [Actinomycetia bacterium]|nr:hypothetical protein [Actinomycetes bacterium]
MRYLLTVFLAVVLTAALVACGGVEPPAPSPTMTVEAYFARCAEVAAEPPVDVREIETWAEMAAALEGPLAELRSIVPPPELAAFHASQLSAVEQIAAFVERQPAGAFNAAAMAETSALVHGTALDAIAALAPALRARAAVFGCIEWLGVRAGEPR